MNLHYGRILCVLAAIAICSSIPATAQSLTTFESKEFDVQFDIPSHWETEVDGETLVAAGDGIVFVITAVKESSVSTEELFSIQVDNLGMDAEGEYEHIELNGGIQGVIGSGAATLDDEPIGVILLAATLDDNNYLAYIFAEPNVFEQHGDTMVEIITSLAPLGWTGE